MVRLSLFFLCPLMPPLDPRGMLRRKSLHGKFEMGLSSRRDGGQWNRLGGQFVLFQKGFLRRGRHILHHVTCLPGQGGPPDPNTAPASHAVRARKQSLGGAGRWGSPEGRSASRGVRALPPVSTWEHLWVSCLRREGQRGLLRGAGGGLGAGGGGREVEGGLGHRGRAAVQAHKCGSGHAFFT